MLRTLQFAPSALMLIALFATIAEAQNDTPSSGMVEGAQGAADEGIKPKPAKFGGVALQSSLGTLPGECTTMDLAVTEFSKEVLLHDLTLKAASMSPDRQGFDLLATADHVDATRAGRLLHRRTSWYVPPSGTHAGGVAAHDVVIESVDGRLEALSTISIEQSGGPIRVRAALVSYASLETTAALGLAESGPDVDAVRYRTQLHLWDEDGRVHAYGLPGSVGRSGGSEDFKSSSECECALSCWTLSGLSPEWQEVVAASLPCLLLEALPACLLDLSLGFGSSLCQLVLTHCAKELAIETFVGWLLENAIEIGACLGQCQLAGSWEPDFIEQSQPKISPNPASPGGLIEVWGSAMYLGTCKYVENGSTEIEVYDENGTISVKNVEIKDGFYSTFLLAPSISGQYGVKSTATSFDYAITSPSITSNILWVVAAPSWIEASIVSLLPNPAYPGQPVTLKGTANYDTGEPVGVATANVTVAGVTWTTPVLGGQITPLTSPLQGRRRRSRSTFTSVHFTVARRPRST